MLVERERLSRGAALTIATITAAVPGLTVACDLVELFHRELRGQAVGALRYWVEEARDRALAAFGRGIAADLCTVSAALTEPWSDGPTKGNIAKLKLLRRQMYRRGKLDLLRARLIAAA